MPGVEIHANIIDNILNRRFLRKVELPAEAAIILLLLATVSFISWKNQLLGTALAIFSAAIWVIAPTSLFTDMVVPVFRPVFLLLLLATIDLYDFIRRVYLDRRRIRAIFSRYVSDSVLHEILAAPDQDFLSGKRRRLCILMADIRGFTTFSEAREATDVVKFLNAYFARVTEIIMKHGGVVDKFLGDGLLAFFNAPVEHPDFADQALKAALEIKNFAESPEFAAICGNAGLKVGTALNIGSVVFGNIGSEKKAEFTVIGDAVNACSRMESLNKDFETDIIVSEDVVKECKTEVEWKLLGKKSLRGKSQEISLYTLVKSGRS
jgi:adenylate cyclase